jgi:hypothetical protein
MTPLELTGMIAGIIVSIGTILSMFGLGTRWLVKHYFDDIKHELKPNGGSSLKDQVNRLEQKQTEADKLRNEMNKKIDHMYEVLLDYISKSSKK